MTKTEVVRYFKTPKAVAEALGITRQAFYQWPEKIPRLRAYELERISGGALRVSGDAGGVPSRAAA